MHANIKQVFLLGDITEINWETKPSVSEIVYSTIRTLCVPL